MIDLYFVQREKKLLKLNFYLALQDHGTEVKMTVSKVIEYHDFLLQ